MNEIYWITRLDKIHELFAFITFTSGLFIAAFIVIFLCCWRYRNSQDNCYKDSVEGFKLSIKSFKFLIPTCIISSMFCIFIPTTKEALLIYEVGSIKEYLEKNPTAKQLPDKAIKALDKYLDSLNDN